MPGGRPTKYTEELIFKAWSYIDGGWEEVGDAMPSHIGLFLHINISNTCGYEWAQEEEKEFSDMLAKITQLQHQVVINKSIRGDYNAAISKLVLTKHGYHDKQDNTLSAPGGGPLQVTELTHEQWLESLE